MATLPLADFEARTEKAPLKAERIYPPNVQQVIAIAAENALTRVRRDNEPLFYDRNTVVYRAIDDIERTPEAKHLTISGEQSASEVDTARSIAAPAQSSITRTVTIPEALREEIARRLAARDTNDRDMSVFDTECVGDEREHYRGMAESALNVIIEWLRGDAVHVAGQTAGASRSDDLTTRSHLAPS